jgi:hypothetical protein
MPLLWDPVSNEDLALLVALRRPTGPELKGFLWELCMTSPDSLGETFHKLADRIEEVEQLQDGQIQQH